LQPTRLRRAAEARRYAPKEHAVRRLHGSWVIVLPLSIGCTRDRQAVRITAQIEQPATMKSAVLERLPRGTPLTAAKEFMEREGFECCVTRKGEFSEQGVVHEGIDYLYCNRHDRVDTWVNRRWQIAVVLEDDKVADVYVSEGLIGP
jgi:hypothetical protein